MKRTIIAVFAVYLVQLGLGELLWPSRDWSAAMILVDAIGAAVVTFHPAGRMQSLIGMTFLPQMALHLGRFINGSHADMNQYFWGLSLLGFAQLVLVGGWWLYDQRDLRRRAYGRAHPAASAVHPKAVVP